MKGMVNYILANIEEFERELERDIIRKDSLKKAVYPKRKPCKSRNGNIKA